MTISTTFKSLKKISRLESVYTDTITRNGRIVIGNIPLDKYYNYQYDRRGRLILKNMKGDLILCKSD
jgi:hypothetical protein